MSCYVVNDIHISVLVSYAIHQRFVDRADLQKTANMLHKENEASVNRRYNDTAETPIRAEFIAYFNNKTAPVKILKALGGYEYQACESEDYYNSKAAVFVRNLRGIAIRQLPGYEDAPWGINDKKEML